MPWWALSLVIVFGLAWVTLPEWLHLYFRWRARKLPPLRSPTLHLRYDWDAELWRPQLIQIDPFLDYIEQRKATGATDEPTR